ncbi:hypothetical protein HMPREF9135_0873 [Segatella baroniae F0067]|uniref:Uncharacterized protein n=1 Tax=Segatella baroniae F0067 TaxID=1115809 RepID=U2NJM0_9BACT|nr:hypothetical protein HMPREF9135_0873 [Segatella baroniae F0067]
MSSFLGFTNLSFLLICLLICISPLGRDSSHGLFLSSLFGIECHSL